MWWRFVSATNTGTNTVHPGLYHRMLVILCLSMWDSTMIAELVKLGSLPTTTTALYTSWLAAKKHECPLRNVGHRESPQA